LLADKALLAAYAQGAARVELAHVKSAVAELPRAQMTLGGWHAYRWRIALGSGAVAALTALASVGLGAWSHAPVVAPAPIAAAVPQAQQALQVPPVPTAATSARYNQAPGDEAQVAGEAVARTQAWLQQENLGGYTIQLAQFDASFNPNRYIRRMATQLTPSKVFVSRTTYKGKTNVSIFFGSFRSAREASHAIESLPAEVKTNQPWVRSWTSIKSEQAP
jgi:septal ring-binding cell division protein DamX